MLEFAQFGAGRIGAIHAANLVALSAKGGGVRLRYVVDTNAKAAQRIAAASGARVVDECTALGDSKVGAVLIASSTDTHARLAMAAARAGKAIFCEKPIDLSLKKVNACVAVVRRTRVPMLVGFNRRFDPDFRELKTRVERGAIGKVELVQITSRDPGLPPFGYLKVAGGLFRDMTIHDFDMARWLLGEEPVEVFARGACLVHPMVKRVGDIDTAVVTLRTASGALAVITNSRRASYGYDQRIEVHGSKGCLSAGNRIETTVRQADGRGVAAAKPQHFFLERYANAYRAELEAFIHALCAKKKMPVGPEDGRQALVLAEAALRSLRTGRAVRVAALR